MLVENPDFVFPGKRFDWPGDVEKDPVSVPSGISGGFGRKRIKPRAMARDR
jgi:hypothetical protein